MFKKANILFLLVAIIIITVLSLSPDRKGRFLPADEAHLTARKNSTNKLRHKECGKCHFEELNGKYPLPDSHKKRERCYGCHWEGTYIPGDSEHIEAAKAKKEASTTACGACHLSEMGGKNPVSESHEEREKCDMCHGLTKADRAKPATSK